MSVINKDLGVVTAYAYAVEAGYTGTEEEFEQALGDLAELVTDFENFTVEVTTLEPGSSATASYADGVLSLGIPEGEKGDTGTTPNLTIGTVTTLAPGSDATATITGTAEAPVLSLGIPEGDPGEVPAAALASDFSASVSYKKGDYVWKSGTLYEFTADHAAGAWTGSDATAAKVADDVADLKSALETGTIKSGIALRFVSGENVKSTTGEIQTNGSYTRTDYMEITDEKALTLFWTTSHGTTLNALCFYDQSKTFISGGANPLTNADDTHTHSIPKNAKYFIFSGTNTAMGKVGAEYVIPFIKPWCYNKNINWIGDSIVAGNDFDEVVASTLFLNETDYGINGSTVALKSDGTDDRNALCVRYSSMSDDADIVAVSCGTNDWMYAWCPIGTINDPDDGTSNTTFYGALKTLCKGLIDKYPQKVIFFTTPIKRGQSFESGNGGEYTADGVPTTPFSKNKYGKTLGDYADIIKEVCGLYSIPVLDMYRESLLNPHISAQQSMFDSILTHPNATGQKIMARRVAGWLMQLGHAV